jgi:hypothetical protein
VLGELTVYRDEKIVWQQEVTLAPGASLFTHSLSLTGDGLIPLRAVFTPRNQQEDAIAQDDHASAWIAIEPQEKVLLLSARAQDSRK